MAPEREMQLRPELSFQGLEKINQKYGMARFERATISLGILLTQRGGEFFNVELPEGGPKIPN